MYFEWNLVKWLKPKTDGHSEANTPITHILSIYLFDSVVFLPPSIIIWKRSWWPLLLITFWHLGATVGFSPRQQKLHQLSEASTCALLVLFPPMPVEILYARFLLSARGSSASALATRRPVLIFFQSLDDTKCRHKLDDISGGHFTTDGHSHAKPPADKLLRVRYGMLQNVVR